MTYQEFFRLKDSPFRLTPDVDYFFPSEHHGAALETLLYSIRFGEAFAQITGQPGVGKTIVVRHLLNQLEGEVRTALILHPRLGGEELLKVILEDLGTPAETIQGKTKEGLLRFFREDLLGAAQAGRSTVVIIDEAQEIPNDTLEELRLLSNLETEKKKLLSIILVGQTELEEKLNDPALRQLHQRITIRYRIEPFTRSETQAYITHRLSIAGAAGNVYFPEKVIHAIHRKSGGIPRQINVMCERALMAACVEGVKTIKRSHLKRAVESYLGSDPGFGKRRLGFGLGALVLLAGVIGGGWWAFSSGHRFATLADVNPGTSSPAPVVQEKTAADATERDASTGATGQPDPPAARSDQAVPETEGWQTNLPIDAVSQEGRLLVVNRMKNQGQVWQGDGDSLRQVASVEWEGWVLEDGIYLLGRDKDKRPFLYHPHRVESWQRYQDLARRLWPQVGAEGLLPIVPLIVWSGKEENRQLSSRNALKVRALINEWAAAWRSQDLEAYMRHYGPTHSNYLSIRSEPTVLSKEQYAVQMARIFQSNRYITLEISEPVCIIDPGAPQTAVAIFSQRYASDRHVDEGVKVLFLKQWNDEGGAEASWKISGRWWMPLPTEARARM